MRGFPWGVLSDRSLLALAVPAMLRERSARVQCNKCSDPIPTTPEEPGVDLLVEALPHRETTLQHAKRSGHSGSALCRTLQEKHLSRPAMLCGTTFVVKEQAPGPNEKFVSMLKLFCVAYTVVPVL